MRHLWRAGVISGSIKAMIADRWGVKLLSKGADRLTVPVNIEVSVLTPKRCDCVRIDIAVLGWR
jgi:hypothetical protein